MIASTMSNETLIQDLKRTLASGSDAQCLHMLSRLTDLFLADADRFTPQQIMLFDEMLTHFVATVDSRARAKLAVQLALVANAPAGVIRTLAFDNHIDVARPVLRQSSALADVDLVANANTMSQQHLLAISERRSLSEAVTDVLVARGNSQVARTVAGNANARFSFAGIRTLVRRAKNDDDLTLAMGSRTDVPRQHMLRLLDAASDKVRARLFAQGDGPTAAMPKVIARIDDSIRDIGTGSFDYAAARPKVEAMYRAGQLNEAAFIQFASEKRFNELAVGLSLVANIDIDAIERALLAPTLEILLIVVKIAGFSRTAAKALIQLKASQLEMSPVALDGALSNFNRLNAGNARKMLGFYSTLSC
jgi:Uncharacterised protein conserved in bacteria (DUF2336)